MNVKLILQKNTTRKQYTTRNVGDYLVLSMQRARCKSFDKSVEENTEDTEDFGNLCQVGVIIELFSNVTLCMKEEMRMRSKLWTCFRNFWHDLWW